MGIKISPLVCLIFMSVWEEIMRNELGLYNLVSFWKRYVDDILLIWKGSREELAIFWDQMNQIDPNIKFTKEEEEPGKPLVCLDVTLEFVEGKIVWKHYRKDTASDQVIHYRSAHDEKSKKELYQFRNVQNLAKL